MSKDKKARKIPRPRSALYIVFKVVLTGPLRLLCNIRVRGRENEPTRDQGAYLVIANHRTWADPIYLCVALRHQQPHFMAKKELFKVPLLGWLIRALGAYPVNRGGADVSAIVIPSSCSAQAWRWVCSRRDTAITAWMQERPRPKRARL